MLTASAKYKEMLNRKNRKYRFKMTVTRNRSGSPPIDITQYVTSYTVNQDFEARSGVLDFEIDNYDWSLSPLNRTSPHNIVDASLPDPYDPLLDSNHKVMLYEGFELDDGTVDLVQKFVGFIGDDITINSNSTISVSCRDASKLLQDIYIYESPSYKLYLVEDVIQDLLDTFAPHLNLILRVANKTTYMIGKPDSPYTAKDTNLWDAVTLLADTASHELRFMESGSLTIRKIERDFSNKLPNLQLDLSVLIENTSTISDADVRNEIVVKVQNYKPVVKKNAKSQYKYGRRYMEVQKGVSDMITDISQAHELAEGILEDLCFAKPSDTAEIPLHPLVQVGDIVWITNERIGTTPESMRYKVVSVDNSYSSTQKRTRLGLQGYDKYQYDRGFPTKAPTKLSHKMQERKIMNYKGSGWEGKSKTMYYPKVTWVAPTEYMGSSETLPTDFGGYVIYRRHKAIISGKDFWYPWQTISSIPAYMESLGQSVNFFYDYSIMNIVDVDRSKDRRKSIDFQYKLVTVTDSGVRSEESSVLSITVKTPFYDDGFFLPVIPR